MRWDEVRSRWRIDPAGKPDRVVLLGPELAAADDVWGTNWTKWADAHGRFVELKISAQDCLLDGSTRSGDALTTPILLSSTAPVDFEVHPERLVFQLSIAGEEFTVDAARNDALFDSDFVTGTLQSGSVWVEEATRVKTGGTNHCHYHGILFEKDGRRRGAVAFSACKGIDGVLLDVANAIEYAIQPADRGLQMGGRRRSLEAKMAVPHQIRRRTVGAATLEKGWCGTDVVAARRRRAWIEGARKRKRRNGEKTCTDHMGVTTLTVQLAVVNDVERVAQAGGSVGATEDAIAIANLQDLFYKEGLVGMVITKPAAIKRALCAHRIALPRK